MLTCDSATLMVQLNIRLLLEVGTVHPVAAASGGALRQRPALAAPCSGMSPPLLRHGTVVCAGGRPPQHLHHLREADLRGGCRAV